MYNDEVYSEEDQLQVILDIDPTVVGLLEGIVSRLRAASTARDVLFEAGEVDSWQLEGDTYQTNRLTRARESLQKLQKVEEAISQLVRVAVTYSRSIKRSLMHLGLLSLPVELLQHILFLSLPRDVEADDAAINAQAVLTLQSVSRYFRDVIQTAPMFWTSILVRPSSIPILELHLERSKNLGLHLELCPSDLLDSRLYEIITKHSGRWQTLILRLQLQEFAGPVQERVSSLTMENLKSLKLHKKTPFSRPPSSSELESAIVHAPGLERLFLFELPPPRSIGVNLTEFALSIERRFDWSGRNLISFVASQKSLERLVLRICCEPSDDKGVLSRFINHSTLVGGRNMFVSLRLDARSYLTALLPVWPAFAAFGIGTLEVDLSRIGVSLQSQALSNALYYACEATGLQTLLIYLSPCSSLNARSGQDALNNPELPLSLQTLLIRNAHYAPMSVLIVRIAYLLARQEALGVTRPLDIVYSGKTSPDADIPVDRLMLARTMNRIFLQ